MDVTLQVKEDRSSDRGEDVAAPTRPARRAPLAARMSLRLRESSRDLASSFTHASLAHSIDTNGEGKNNANAPQLCDSVAGHMSTEQAARLVAIEVFGEAPGQGGNKGDPNSTILAFSVCPGFVEDASASDGVSTASRLPQRARLASSMFSSLRMSSRDLTASFINISLTKGVDSCENGHLLGRTVVF